MKGSESFKTTISNHLNERAAQDPLFAVTLAKPNKNIEDCITYIFKQVQASGCNGFADSEIYGMAVHYYDEDDIKVGAKINATVVVNHKVELTADEKEKARQAAFDKVAQEAIAKKKKPVSKQIVTGQQSLF